MATNNQRIIEKIKHCLALSKSSNENEAAMALRQAHAMMQKHNISMHQIKLSDITRTNSQTTVAQKPHAYQVMLANLIAKKFGCQIYLDFDYEADKQNICFVGIDLYSTIASYAFDVLSRQLKQARLNYIKTELKRVRIAKNKYARADKFCIGWVTSVARLIQNLVPPKIDMKLIESKMQSLSLVAGKSVNRADKAPKSKTTNDFINGKLQGSKANLHNAMHSNPQSTLLEAN